MNPPSVYELTIPNSQRIKSNMAIVQSIVIPFLEAVYANQLPGVYVHRSIAGIQ
jgi:hypothetical protein